MEGAAHIRSELAHCCADLLANCLRKLSHHLGHGSRHGLLQNLTDRRGDPAHEIATKLGGDLRRNLVRKFR